MTLRWIRPRPRRIAGAAAVFALLLAACGPPGPREQPNAAGRRVALEQLSRINAGLLPGGGGLAGISAQGVSGVVPLAPRRLGDRADSTAFRDLVHRCTACHVAPDPSMHTAGEWPVVISRMKDNIRLAGLLPLRPREERMITQFLTRRQPLAR